MQIFEYVAVLTSIIIGLGLTHLLRGVAGLIQHPGRAEIYWVHLVWVAFMFFNLIFWWWWEFRLNEVPSWTFHLYAFVILYAFVFFLACALLFPVDLEGYDGFRDYYYSRRGWFFGILIFSLLIDVGDSWLKGSEHFSNLGIEYAISTLAKAGLFLTAAIWRNEKFHASLAITALLYQVSWAFRLFATIA